MDPDPKFYSINLSLLDNQHATAISFRLPIYKLHCASFLYNPPCEAEGKIWLLLFKKFTIPTCTNLRQHPCFTIITKLHSLRVFISNFFRFILLPGINIQTQIFFLRRIKFSLNKLSSIRFQKHVINKLSSLFNISRIPKYTSMFQNISYTKFNKRKNSTMRMILNFNYIQNITCILLLCFFCLQSCKEVMYTPKPRMFPKIEYPSYQIKEYISENCPYNFRYPDYFNIILSIEI